MFTRENGPLIVGTILALGLAMMSHGAEHTPEPDRICGWDRGFHVAAVDAAGNRGPVTTAGPYLVDTTVDDRRLLLHGGRFVVEAEWEDFTGGTGPARAVPFQSEDSGLLWFFDPDNWELLVKVLDGCAVNGRFWVFTAATTNVGTTLRVTDTRTGAEKQYTNPLGRAAHGRGGRVY